MTKFITLAKHQSVTGFPKTFFVGYEVEIHPTDPYPWATFENLRPHLCRLEEHTNDWLTEDECKAWAYLKEEVSY